jgi:hypothetical protein
VVDGDGVIIVGHTRYKAALKLGLQKVPVHVATDLTPEQAVTEPTYIFDMVGIFSIPLVKINKIVIVDKIKGG